jgi:hypothetical protein
MRAAVRVSAITKSSWQRIRQRRLRLKTGFVERLLRPDRQAVLAIQRVQAFTLRMQRNSRRRWCGGALK